MFPSLLAQWQTILNFLSSDFMLTQAASFLFLKKLIKENKNSPNVP